MRGKRPFQWLNARRVRFPGLTLLLLVATVFCVGYSAERREGTFKRDAFSSNLGPSLFAADYFFYGARPEVRVFNSDEEAREFVKADAGMALGNALVSNLAYVHDEPIIITDGSLHVATGVPGATLLDKFDLSANGTQLTYKEAGYVSAVYIINHPNPEDKTVVQTTRYDLPANAPVKVSVTYRDAANHIPDDFLTLRANGPSGRLVIQSPQVPFSSYEQATPQEWVYERGRHGGHEKVTITLPRGVTVDFPEKHGDTRIELHYLVPNTP